MAAAKALQAKAAGVAPQRQTLKANKAAVASSTSG